MKIQERYMTARNTSNLKSTERTSLSPADLLAAAGMAGQKNGTALLLWEVTFKGKTQSKNALVEALAHKLADHMLRTRQNGDPRRIATECIAWTLHGTCQPCGGRGYETIADTPTLSDDLCKHCHGTGKIAAPATDAHKWMIDYMSELTARAAGSIMRKLDL